MKWTRENIEQIPSLTPFVDYIGVIETNIIQNPTLCVETCKAFIEGICKTILTNKNISFAGDSTCPFLVKSTIDAILQTDDRYRSDIIDLGRRMAGVADKIQDIRNNTTFSSHGMDVLNPRLTEGLAFFACKITDTLCGFILHCYNNNRVVSPDHRIHYDDCMTFNEDFDARNPVQFGLVAISASEALFEQDYEAYKAEFLEFLSGMQSEGTTDEVINE